MLGLESWIPIYMTGQISPYYLKEVKNSAKSNKTEKQAKSPINYTKNSYVNENGVIILKISKCEDNEQSQTKMEM